MSTNVWHAKLSTLWWLEDVFVLSAELESIVIGLTVGATILVSFNVLCEPVYSLRCSGLEQVLQSTLEIE